MTQPPRHNNRFSKEHLVILKEMYATKPKPTMEELEELSVRMSGENVKKLKTWFTNQRARDKKEREKRRLMDQIEGGLVVAMNGGGDIASPGGPLRDDSDATPINSPLPMPTNLAPAPAVGWDGSVVPQIPVLPFVRARAPIRPRTSSNTDPNGLPAVEPIHVPDRFTAEMLPKRGVENLLHLMSSRHYRQTSQPAAPGEQPARLSSIASGAQGDAGSGSDGVSADEDDNDAGGANGGERRDGEAIEEETEDGFDERSAVRVRGVKRKRSSSSSSPTGGSDGGRGGIARRKAAVGPSPEPSDPSLSSCDDRVVGLAAFGQFLRRPGGGGRMKSPPATPRHGIVEAAMTLDALRQRGQREAEMAAERANVGAAEAANGDVEMEIARGLLQLVSSV
ncbi:hypothetical protein HK101_007304 [Irineochytrium annulatum]|nr:hypothetical protein HK101_007304 [Irineochytrium annulatum]